LEHGQISTQELKDKYGYNHPPRAARDVKEHGIPLERFTVVGTDGRKIAAYRFTDPEKITLRRFDGRTGPSKEIKEKLIEKYGSRCFIYLEEMPERRLQIDHRVPYEVAGDPADSNLDDYMLLCGSANRAKSWSCEHCPNWIGSKVKSVCLSCYWAYPESYTHVATEQIRRLDLMWQGKEVKQYEKLQKKARKAGKETPRFVKEILERATKG
jgi:hypothetical protein